MLPHITNIMPPYFYLLKEIDYFTNKSSPIFLIDVLYLGKIETMATKKYARLVNLHMNLSNGNDFYVLF